MYKLTLFLLSFFVVTSINAQNFQDDCAEVLRYSSKDITTNYSKANTAKHIYDQYCEGTDVKSGVNIGIEAEDLLESVGLNFGSTKESVRNVCQTYQSDYKSLVEEDKRSSIVVREAISAWLECKRLSNQGIKINPNFQKTQFSIDFRREGDDIEINGVDYNDDNCECKARIEIDGQTQLSIVNSETNHNISDGNYWNLRCKRLPQTVDGVEIYNEVDLGVSTSKGTFVITLPRDVRPTYSWVSNVLNEIEQIKTNIKSNKEEMAQTISTVNSRFGKITFKQVCVKRQENCNGSKFNAIKTPDGFFYTGITETNTYPGGPCGQGTQCKVFMKIDN